MWQIDSCFKIIKWISKLYISDNICPKHAKKFCICSLDLVSFTWNCCINTFQEYSNNKQLNYSRVNITSCLNANLCVWILLDMESMDLFGEAVMQLSICSIQLKDMKYIFIAV